MTFSSVNEMPKVEFSTGACQSPRGTRRIGSYSTSTWELNRFLIVGSRLSSSDVPSKTPATTSFLSMYRPERISIMSMTCLSEERPPASGHLRKDTAVIRCTGPEQEQRQESCVVISADACRHYPHSRSARGGADECRRRRWIVSVVPGSGVHRRS